MDLANWIFWCLTVLTAISARSSTANDSSSHDYAFRQDPWFLQLGEIHYLADLSGPVDALSSSQFTLHKLASRTGPSPDEQLLRQQPATVFAFDTRTITLEQIQHQLDEYFQDDVFSVHFLRTVYIASSAPNPKLHRSAWDYLETLGVTNIVLQKNKPSYPLNFYQKYLRLPSATPKIAPGPYLASHSSTSIAFFNIFRLYPDTHRAFLHGIYADRNGLHRTVNYFFPECACAAIPVPSLILSQQNHDTQPLAGYRVGLKDAFRVKGLKASGGSKAWLEVQDIAESTAPIIQNMLDQGAVLVGKQKLAQFSSGAQAWEWEEEHYPFNPRGDGWLSCSASSAGSACATAAYDWLTISIGSDTGGSVRMPAALAGVYGNRPSQGHEKLIGMMPLGQATDTIGVFARDPQKWSHFVKHLYSAQIPESSLLPSISAPSHKKQFPNKLLIPRDYFIIPSPTASAMTKDFIRNFAHFFGMTTTDFNVTSSILNASDPIAADFQARLNDIFILNSQQSYEEIYKPLLSLYPSQNNGRMPSADSDFRTRIPYFLDRMSTEDPFSRQILYNTTLALKARAMKWFHTALFPSSATSCSANIMLYPSGSGGLPSYREQHLNTDPKISSDTSYTRPLAPGVLTIPSSICSLFGCVDYTLVIGQVEYMSAVTGQVEQVPVTVNAVVRRGCDFMLFDMVEKMAQEGMLKTVKVGREAF